MFVFGALVLSLFACVPSSLRLLACVAADVLLFLVCVVRTS